MCCYHERNVSSLLLRIVPGAKQEVEFKLNSINSSLRRTLGIGAADLSSDSPAFGKRSRSPTRRRARSPHKGKKQTIGWGEVIN